MAGATIFLLGQRTSALPLSTEEEPEGNAAGNESDHCNCRGRQKEAQRREQDRGPSNSQLKHARVALAPVHEDFLLRGLFRFTPVAFFFFALAFFFPAGASGPRHPECTRFAGHPRGPKGGKSS